MILRGLKKNAFGSIYLLESIACRRFDGVFEQPHTFARMRPLAPKRPTEWATSELRAGHPEPEFLEVAGAVGVRFLPSGYVAPLRVAHDLTDRQRRILQVIADGKERPFASIRAQIDPAIAERTLHDDVLHLKRLGLIDSRGHGRGTVWFLGAAPKLEGEPNKAE